jgi:hypothetical protein
MLLLSRIEGHIASPQVWRTLVEERGATTLKSALHRGLEPLVALCRSNPMTAQTMINTVRNVESDNADLARNVGVAIAFSCLNTEITLTQEMSQLLHAHIAPTMMQLFAESVKPLMIATLLMYCNPNLDLPDSEGKTPRALLAALPRPLQEFLLEPQRCRRFLHNISVARIDSAGDGAEMHIEPLVEVVSTNADRFSDYESKVKIPSEYICSITNAIITDPVYDPRHTEQRFERTAIENWLRRNPTNPLTREPLTRSALQSDTALKNRINGFIDRTIAEHASTPRSKPS